MKAHDRLGIMTVPDHDLGPLTTKMNKDNLTTIPAGHLLSLPRMGANTSSHVKLARRKGIEKPHTLALDKKEEFVVT